MDISPFDHVEKIRRAAFSIGRDGGPNTADLRKASDDIRLDLLTRNSNFLDELFRNAEDNEYPSEDDPSLEFVLTTRDITMTGARETLLVFNNEVGLSALDVKSICRLPPFKKRGKHRGNEKGIGFNSVFRVSKQAYIFSNGYRIRFDEEPHKDCGIRFIVPEWFHTSPSFSDIQHEYGPNKELPTTVIILPLKSDKVEYVRRLLGGIDSEILLFSKIKQLSVRQNQLPILNMGSSSSFLITNETGPILTDKLNNRSCLAHLTLQCATICGPVKRCKCDYYMWKQRFPVNFMDKMEEKGEVDDFVITIVFPLGERLGEGVSAFSSLPTTIVSELPFIFQSDFIVTPSREMILENKWNKGLLDCVPPAFLNAFLSCLHCETRFPWFSPALAYEFLPGQACLQGNSMESITIQAISEAIRRLLKELCIVPCESFSSKEEVYARPCDVKRLLPVFRKLLNRMKQQGVCLEGVQSDGNFILHASLDSVRYTEALKFLGVDSKLIDPSWYWKCIQNCNLLSSASEEVYIDILCSFAEHWDTFRGTTATKPIIKYIAKDDIQLCSIHETRSNKFHLYYSIDSHEHAWLNKWWRSFGSVTKMFLLSDSTQDALLNHQRKYFLCAWLELEASVSSTSVRDFSTQFVGFLSKNSDLDAVIWLAYFLHQSLLNKFISETEVCLICQMMPIVDGSGCVHIERNKTLVPACGSKWSKLFGSNPYTEEKYIDIGAVYEEIPQSNGFLSCFLRYTEAIDLLDLNPPNVPLSVCASGLTSEQALLLLDWLHVLRKRGIECPSHFIGSIQDGKWLKTVSGFSSPSQCFFLDESVKSTCKEDHKVIISTPIIDQKYYEDKITLYMDELKAIGVKFVPWYK